MTMSPIPAATDSELIARHGIIEVRADHYHVDGYRYTRLADAVAQARRTAAAGER
jgi:hypothetical protein